MARKSTRRSGSVVTIHDVARHAGVSPMTVSRVINSETNVREETRAKVAASIKTLRYSPNLAARSLASADTVHIGILYANSTAAYLSELLLGSLEQSSLAGCQLVIERCDSDEGQTIARLVQGGVHGVILPAPLCARVRSGGSSKTRFRSFLILFRASSSSRVTAPRISSSVSASPSTWNHGMLPILPKPA